MPTSARAPLAVLLLLAAARTAAAERPVAVEAPSAAPSAPGTATAAPAPIPADASAGASASAPAPDPAPDSAAAATGTAPAPPAFTRWRAGFIATAAISVDGDLTGALTLGAYPWRWAGFELRRVWIGQKSGTFVLSASGASATGGVERNLWTEGVITELAFVVRSGGWEPWLAAGRWSGQVSTSGPGGGIDLCASLPCPSISSSGTQWRATVGAAAALGAGLRYRSRILLIGLEARQVLFGARTQRIAAIGLDVPLRGTFLGLTLGFAVGGPVERGE